MDIAVDEGIVDRPLNTYEAISRLGWFNPKSFRLNVISDIVGLNTHPIDDPQLQGELEVEHEIVERVLEGWYGIYRKM
jgi:hypothetical protein